MPCKMGTALQAMQIWQRCACKVFCAESTCECRLSEGSNREGKHRRQDSQAEGRGQRQKAKGRGQKATLKGKGQDRRPGLPTLRR